MSNLKQWNAILKLFSLALEFEKTIHEKKKGEKNVLARLRILFDVTLFLNRGVCVCVCVCVRVYVVYEDTNLFNNMGMTEVLQFEGGLWGHCLCPRNSKGLKNILNGVFLKI